MNYEPKSIDDHIECLARLTGAPGSFVEQVRALFTNKGIPLESEARPFLQALEEAFRREERIRCSAHRARQNLAKVDENFQRVGKAYVRQLTQLKRAESSPREPRRLHRTLVSRPGTTHVTITGDHRTFVTRPVREELPMVPGPKEIQ